MADRIAISSSTVGAVTGDAYMDNTAAHLTALYDAAAFPLTSVGGTGDAVTASLDPVLTAGLTEGMKFTLSWASANTGGVTLAINGGAAVAVLTAAGTALNAGGLQPGARALLEVVGSDLRIIGGASGADAGALPSWQVFTASATWTKPGGYPDDTAVLIEAWGGGGGGDSSATGGGGGGGGYASRIVRIADIASTVTVTVGSGGAVNTGGGTSSFGALVTAYGGGRGWGKLGGGGGGSMAAGVNNLPGVLGGGAGGPEGVVGSPASMECGGGGGGSSDNSGVGYAGGMAHFGGGGGGGGFLGSASGGVSLHGGNGGNGGTSATAGSAPAGGGGRNSAGARGEVRIRILA